MSADIFISLASADRNLAERLTAHIEARGFRCWVAHRDIPAGDNYQEAITRALRGSKILLSLISRNANTSIEMQKELSLASRYKLMVIPLRLEDVEPNDAFLYEFATRQWIDLFRNWNGGCEKLLSEIGSLVEPDRVAPRATPQIRSYAAPPAAPVMPSRVRTRVNPDELPKALAQNFAAAKPPAQRDIIPPRPPRTLGTKPITGIPLPAGTGAADNEEARPGTDQGSAIGPVMALLAAIAFAVVLAISLQRGEVSPPELLFWAILLAGCARLLASLVRFALYGSLAPET